MKILRLLPRLGRVLLHQPSSLRPRKAPRQKRAVDAYASMLEATAQMLESQRISADSTRLIAARVGVSIGSLCPYFPGRHALLIALTGIRRRAFKLPRAYRRLSAIAAAGGAVSERTFARPAASGGKSVLTRLVLEAFKRSLPRRIVEVDRNDRFRALMFQEMSLPADRRMQR